MSKSIFTMSAAQRLKAQERQSRRFDRAVNKKFREMKKAWKKKIAGKVVKGVAFVAIAAGAGAVIGKGKEIIRTKSGDELREMAAKIKVKFDEKRTAVKKWNTAAKSKAAGAAETGAEVAMTACTPETNEVTAANTASVDGVAEAAAVNAAGEDGVAEAAVIDEAAAVESAGEDGAVQAAVVNEAADITGSGAEK